MRIEICGKSVTVDLVALDGRAVLKIEMSAELFDEICAADAHLEDMEDERISGGRCQRRRAKS